MGLPTLQTLNDPILLLSWLCFRGLSQTLASPAPPETSNPDGLAWRRASAWRPHSDSHRPLKHLLLTTHSPEAFLP
jgi:hypothetical protein